MNRIFLLKDVISLKLIDAFYKSSTNTFNFWKERL